MASRIKKGDLVEVITGRYRRTRGKVIEVITDTNRVRVEGVATVKRHLKAGRDPKIQNGGIIEKIGTIHISNVMPIDPQSGRRTRVGFRVLDDGRKVRYAKKSGEQVGNS